MGLDISLVSEKQDLEYNPDNFKKHSLSREFCYLIGRKHLVRHKPELDQIGDLTGVEISCFYKMEEYPCEEEISMRLERAENDKEKKRILNQFNERKKSLTGNLEFILLTISNLIEKLNKINNLNSLLIPTYNDTLNSEYYFSDFKIDKGDGYINNNFGQDLRNFKSYLLHAKSNKNESVWFLYG